MIETNSDLVNSLESNDGISEEEIKTKMEMSSLNSKNCSSVSPDLIAHLASFLDLDVSILKDDTQESLKEALLNTLHQYLDGKRNKSQDNKIKKHEIDFNCESDDVIQGYGEKDEESTVEEEEFPRNLIASCLPSKLFDDIEVKNKFESIFRSVDYRCKFSYFRIFRRCSIDFEEPIAALIARIELEGINFLGQKLKMFLNKPIKLKNSMPFLKPPKNEKSFLISPPSSPPVGWEQSIEDPPVINYDLLVALSQLNPKPCEIIKSSEDVPGIIIYPCEDPQDFDFGEDNKLRKFIQTRRPPINMD